MAAARRSPGNPGRAAHRRDLFALAVYLAVEATYDLATHFSARAFAALEGRLAAVAEARRPRGDFEALSWSAALVQDMLNVALFGGAPPAGLLSRFLRPLHRGLPVPMLPRPQVFGRVETASTAALADPVPDSVTAHLAAAAADAAPGGRRAAQQETVKNLRVALAAGYDTTSHTLAWAVWHLAGHPPWRDPQTLTGRAYVTMTGFSR